MLMRDQVTQVQAMIDGAISNLTLDLADKIAGIEIKMKELDKKTQAKPPVKREVKKDV